MENQLLSSPPWTRSIIRILENYRQKALLSLQSLWQEPPVLNLDLGKKIILTCQDSVKTELNGEIYITMAKNVVSYTMESGAHAIIDDEFVCYNLELWVISYIFI